MINFAIDVCQYVAAGLLLLFAKAIGKITYWEKMASYAAGVLSVAILIAFKTGRQSLKLKNRGGAHANVDEVDILAINNVKKQRMMHFSPLHVVEGQSASVERAERAGG